MSLLIKNGQIVTSSERYVADIFCEGETITRIDRDIVGPPGAEIINASGKYVFPGFIDPHTHIYLPFMGTFSKDTYETGSKAALVGGTTTIFDMCIPSREMEASDGFRTWQEQSEGKSACDYAFHTGVTKFDKATADQLRAIVKEGIASFKVFLAYKGAFGIDDSELARRLPIVAEDHVLRPAVDRVGAAGHRVEPVVAVVELHPGLEEPVSGSGSEVRVGTVGRKSEASDSAV